MASRASSKGTTIRWSRNRGRNGWDVSTDIGDEFSAESMNVLLERNTLGRKRRGGVSQTFTGDSFSGYLNVFRFVPAAGAASAQIFIVSNDGTTKILRVSAGSAAANLTLTDNVATAPSLMTAATLNNKLYLAYDSTVNRLHVFDPTISTTVVRRAGLATPGVASVANTGSGSYAATARYYRIEWRNQSGSTIQRRSLLGTAVAFTPSGSGTHARITQPTPPGEGETHWAIWASADGVLYYAVTSVVVGTTTYDDNSVVADYDQGLAAPDEGAYTPFPSVKYLLSTGERLMGFGVWESSAGDSVTPKNGRVYFTPVLDSSSSDDDERISNTVNFQGWIDVGRNGPGAEDRAIAGPIDGAVLVFQSKGVYMLVPTGEANNPFRRVTLTQEVGALSYHSTFMGEDEVGAPAIYWCDPVRGPFRYGRRGIEWLGYDVQDVWATVNIASASGVTVIGVYDPELRACLYGLVTGASTSVNEYLVLFVRETVSTGADGVRGGWVRWAETTPSESYCMALLPTTIGATMSRGLKPYVGNTSTLIRWNDTTVQQDAGASFQAYITSKAFDVGAFYQKKRLQASYLQAAAANAVTITQTLTRNFGDETARTDSRALTAAGSETRVIRKFEASALADAQTVQVKLGDSAAANNTWTLDEWAGLVEPTEDA